VIGAVPVLIVTTTILWRECHSAKHFSRLRCTNDLEMAEPLAIWQSGSVEAVGDFNKQVRVGALISTGAEVGGRRVDRCSGQ
jgi:hypothetical protein